jgi:cellulose synthase/poly-beta-1,6-N-acetylglucosamine synthase-like glycosyltransferase
MAAGASVGHACVDGAEPGVRRMITVGVPARNAARTLPRLLESLLGQEQSGLQVEVIVADNGSTDETAAIVRRYAQRGTVRLVQASHRRGPSVARNAVVAAARGEIIAFVDADCIAHPSWLKQIHAGFSDPSVGCVAGAILAADPRTPTERFCARHHLLAPELTLAHRFLPFVATANAAFRSELFRQVGGFDETLIAGEDADLLWRMQLETGYRLAYRPDAVVWHRHRDSPNALLRQQIVWGTGSALLYRKYHRRMPREPWRKLLWDYRRILGLAKLSLCRWIQVRLGRTDREALHDAYLCLLLCLGMKLGRWKGSLAAGVFYP